MNIKNIIGEEVKGKRVLFRPDINSTIDENGKIKGLNRLKKNAPTIKYLLDGGAKLAIIAHQGDTLDYQNLVSMQEHAEILSNLTGCNIAYTDDVCGDAAIAKIKSLKNGEAVLLGNLRYLTEEVSTFEKDVKLTAEDMEKTYLVRRLKDLFDIYVNDAFSAAHRNSPSMCAFQRLLPSYAGPLFFEEYSILYDLMNNAQRPCVFLLGGAKISDAFGMMNTVLSENRADKILVSGVTGVIMHIANGADVGASYTKWLKDRDLLAFVPEAKRLLENFGDKFVSPVDFAFEKDGARAEIALKDLKGTDYMLLDVGHKSVELFKNELKSAKTIFVNGPAGVYENPLFDYGTKELWLALENSTAKTVIGGGDTVTAAGKFIDTKKLSNVLTSGGAMVQFLSGKPLPLVKAFQ
ncbi:MAG: phosphoglycerate kinase [Christensenellaceae bacterium]|jgi:phosphoglycerate kinase|nr:phosphoglycerate kinase [Christensenellaceae bacterium]